MYLWAGFWISGCASLLSKTSQGRDGLQTLPSSDAAECALPSLQEPLMLCKRHLLVFNILQRMIPASMGCTTTT